MFFIILTMTYKKNFIVPMKKQNSGSKTNCSSGLKIQDLDSASCKAALNWLTIWLYRSLWLFRKHTHISFQDKKFQSISVKQHSCRQIHNYVPVESNWCQPSWWGKFIIQRSSPFQSQFHRWQKGTAVSFSKTMFQDQVASYFFTCPL